MRLLLTRIDSRSENIILRIGVIILVCIAWLFDAHIMLGSKPIYGKSGKANRGHQHLRNSIL